MIAEAPKKWRLPAKRAALFGVKNLPNTVFTLPFPDRLIDTLYDNMTGVNSCKVDA
jgi:hypothetical protein